MSLFVAGLGKGLLQAMQCVAGGTGGPGESVLEPHWAADGSLYFLCDRNDWWNLYRWREGQPVQAMTQLQAEIGAPLLGAGLGRLWPAG